MSLHAPSSPSPSRDADPIAPELPHHMASTRQHTADEVLAMMNSTPLFMTELPEGSGAENPSGPALPNPELEAIRALQYEGTRAEIAQNFREQGNEMTRAKRWRDGREFYTKALEALRTESLDREADSNGSEEEKERSIEEACYSNRALCNLSLQNYRSTLNDCASTLHLKPNSLKAFYRSASALFHLQKFALALDACEKGIQIDAAEPSLLALKKQINAAIGEEKERVTARETKKQREQAEKHILMLALSRRGVKIRTSDRGPQHKQQQPDLEDAVVKLEDPMNESSTLLFPLLIIFPQAAQTDFIKSVTEDDTLDDILRMILPPPWIETTDNGFYRSSAEVEVYAERIIAPNGTEGRAGNDAKGLLKVGRKMKLGKILEAGVGLIDGMMRVYILPKGKAGSWIEEMRIRMAR